jgi:membrane protease subunit (stomatin/prohibitin family)
MAVIDRVKWDGTPNILAWKFPSEELSTWTQLIVNESQEAYLVRGGVYEGPFGAGRHTLSTENIPLISKLINLPFGGKTPFTAEVWYVNRVTNLDIKWGTPDPIQLEDPKYRVMLPIRAFGQYGIRIIESKKFLLKIVGTLKEFDSDTLSEYFRGVLITKIKTEFRRSLRW